MRHFYGSIWAFIGLSGLASASEAKPFCHLPAQCKSEPCYQCETKLTWFAWYPCSPVLRCEGSSAYASIAITFTGAESTPCSIGCVSRPWPDHPCVHWESEFFPQTCGANAVARRGRVGPDSVAWACNPGGTGPGVPISEAGVDLVSAATLPSCDQDWCSSVGLRGFARAASVFVTDGPGCVTFSGQLDVRTESGSQNQLQRGGAFPVLDGPLADPAMSGIAPVAWYWNGCATAQQAQPIPGKPDGVFSFNVPANLGTNVSLDTVLLYFTDTSADINGDGRWNEVDASVVGFNVGNAATGTLARADLDSSGTIDSFESSVWSRAVEVGMSSGIFGDANADGRLSCADRDAAPAAPWLTTFCSPTYRVRLDSDVDGDNDEVDRAAFAALMLVDLDFNNDGDVSPLDVEDLVGAFGGMSCPGCDTLDINDDGDVAPIDLEVFINAMAGASC